MDAIKNIVLNTNQEALEDIISPFIKEQFPTFIQSDYPKLVLFLKSYYEWLEAEGNAGFITSKLDTIWDVDRSLDEFYSHFKNTYLNSFPDSLAIKTDGSSPNRKNILKKIRDFYGNKGTESAYAFLFRILYDSDVEIYYPKVDILKVSDGSWTEPKSVKTTVVNGTNLFGGKNGQLYQYSGQRLVASAFIDSVVQYSFNGIPVCEFFIKDINGTFTPNESVKIVKDSSEWTEIAYSVLGEFYIELPGNGYRVGDVVSVVDSTGTGFSAKVDQVGLAGSIKRIGISNSGINYSGDIIVNIFSESGLQTAKVVALKSAVTNYPGYFLGNNGKLSSNKKIQDGHYYQNFSYELKSEISLDTYFSVLKKLIHPSGMKMFGSILVKKALENTLTNSTQSVQYEIPIVGRYTPYKFGTTLDLRSNGVTLSGYWLGSTGDLYPLGYNPYIGSTTEVGPNGATTSLGTIFVGTSLGYTWCYVPEGGRTSHNPIGSPLGSTTSWYLGKENVYSPASMSGLVLWLKPENIGVCGSVVNGASMEIWRDASVSQNHALPPTWDRWTTVPAYAGVTIDKLRPTLVINDNGVAGATGISFDGGVIFGPQTIWNGLSLGSSDLGITFAPGSSGDKLLVGRHFYLKNGLTLSADSDVFVVFRSAIDDYGYGLGLVSSPKKFTDQHFATNEDYVIFSRSYNSVDRNSSYQTDSYYDFAGSVKHYPSSTGLVGFKPYLPFTDSTGNDKKTVIAYDPHVSGQSMGMVIGEAVRDETGIIGAYANGDSAINRSRSTSVRVSNFFKTGAETERPGYTGPITLGRFGSYHLSTVVSGSTFGSSSWIADAKGNTAYGFRGVINEVIVFNRKLREEERQQIYGYLSLKYKMDTKLPNSYRISHNSAYPFGLTYWNIEHHPNTKGLSGIPSGVSFSGITISNFLLFADYIYKSKGTVLSDGTVLAGDTYSGVGP